MASLFQRNIAIALIICFARCVYGADIKKTSLSVVRSILKDANYSFSNRLKFESEVMFTGQVITNDYYVALKCANRDVCVITPSYLYVIMPLSSNIYVMKTKGRPTIVLQYTDKNEVRNYINFNQQDSKRICDFQLDDLYKRWSDWIISSLNENTELYRDPRNNNKYTKLSVGSNPLFYSLQNISGKFEHEFWCSQDASKIQTSEIKPTHEIEFANDSIRTQFEAYLGILIVNSIKDKYPFDNIEKNINQFFNENKDNIHYRSIRP